MKASIFDHVKLWVWSAALTAVVVAAGCSDGGSNGNGPTDGVVSISSIIVNPKSAEPEDTISATAVLEGAAMPGDFPSVQWTTTGGSFITDDEMSVRWIAPETPGVYRLTCRATSGETSDEMAVDVFVGESLLSVNRNAGEIQLTSTSGRFYYLHSIPSDEAWDSSRVYIQATGVPEPVIPGVRVGAQFAFSSAMQYAAYVVNDAGGRWGLDPLDVYVIDLNGSSERKITTDRSTSQRRQRFTRPYFSPDENWVTYEGMLPNEQAGNIDTLDVFVYDLVNDEETNVTEGDVVSTQRRNLFPTYATDSKWMVFVSDKWQPNLWDLYGVRLDGTGAIADTDTVRQLTTGGLIGLSSVASLGKPLLAWNPTQPVLGVVGAAGSDGGLHLVTTNDQGATTNDVRDVGDQVQEIAWSGNGQTLAVSSLVESSTGEGVDNVIFTVTPTGVATLRHRARQDDRILDMGWSADGKFLVYRLVRGAESWLKLIDIDGGTSYPVPLAITKAAADGLRGIYAAEMSSAVRYGSGDIIYFIIFDENLTASGTPTIWTLDVSVAVQP